MRSFFVITLLAFFAQAHTEEVEANDMNDSQLSADTLVDKLVNELADNSDENGEEGEEDEASDENDDSNEGSAGDDSMDEFADMLMDKMADKLFDFGLNEYAQGDAYTPDTPEDDQPDEDELVVVEDDQPDEEAALADALGLRGGAAMKAMKAMAAMKAMKAMSAMKAMKGMKAMKAMKKKAMKKLKAFTLKRYAFTGKVSKTASGLTKSDLVKNKRGKIVSKKVSARQKNNPWIIAVQKARKALGTKGFAKIKKGTPLYTKAKSFMR
jgi:hypothetical protein